MKIRYKLIFMVLVLLMTSQAIAQRKMSIQERLSRLEQQAGLNSAQNTGDLVIQIQQLQTQIAELQGLFEEQNYQIEELKKRQKVLYVDMDSRIAALEGGNVNPVNQTTPGDSGVATTPTNADAQTSQVVINQDVPEVRAPIEADIQTTTIANAAVEGTTNATDPQADALYERAFSELKSGRFTESARLFEDFIQRYPRHDLTDNSYYWLGESHYVSRNYPLALAAFQTLEDQFPLSSKLSDALLKIGYTYHELEDYTQAQIALNKVINSFPGTSVSRLAENRLNLLRREGKIN